MKTEHLQNRPLVQMTGTKARRVKSTFCKLSECDARTSHASGWCEKHYENWLNTGDASKAKKDTTELVDQEAA